MAAHIRTYRLKSKQILFILAATYIIVRLCWMFMIPMVEAPDEFSHFWVIKFLTTHMALPTAAEVSADGPSSVYGSLPQMGYIPHVIAAQFGPAAYLPMLARLGSLIPGLIVVLSSYYLGLEVFGESALCAVALPISVLFHPQFIFVNSYSNTDSTTSALSTILLLLTVRLIKSGQSSVRLACLFGFLLGWMCLSKYASLGLLPAFAFALVSVSFIHRWSIQRSLIFASVLLSSFITTCGWWFWRNYFEYAGDYLGTKTMYRSWATTYHRDLNFHMSPLVVLHEHGWWRMMIFSYWGMFGYMTRFMWRPFYFIYLGFMLLALIAALAKGILFSRSSARIKLYFSDRANLTQPAIWLTMIIAVLANLALMVAASSVNLGGATGRYLFPSEAAILTLLIGGLHSLRGKAGSIAVISFTLFTFIVSVYSFILLYRLYGFRVDILH